ncbi:STAS domain-containing protein [Streptomyces sp. NBC_01498]|uniref:STAS domain-containing protein n=1 Tax=Streptomyces sp. NBC_01498 TaxID=2975870 RepID=UPI002E7ADEF5|nr:STAS domain-containing protein [Streptomyces sp. NBC_01498]WTL28088.1 STAS domain-containing protein [Streptomyces sp. NBC_01498]
MTTIPPAGLLLTPSLRDEHTVCVAVVGDLDYDSARRLLDEAERQLTLHPAARHLRLDCSRLVTCDSMGLAMLLAVRRVTGAAGVRLHLDGRAASLERILRVTGTLDHLTYPPAGTEDMSDDGQQDVPGGEHS